MTRRLADSVFATVVVLVCGCGSTTTVVTYPGIPDTHMHVENLALPAPTTQPASGPTDFATPLPAGVPASQPGVLVSESRALYLVRLATDDKTIRALYGADKQVWIGDAAIYEGQIKSADTEIAALTRGWFDENKGTIGLITGFCGGVLATILTVHFVH